MDFLKKIIDKLRIGGLIVASIKGRISKVEKYIRIGVNINGTDAEGDSALILAAHKGQFNRIKLLLENGANPNQKNIKEGITPIFSAILGSHSNVVKLLIEYGADLNATDNLGNTPLLASVYSNKSDQVTITLIEANSDVNFRNKLDGNYPLIVSTLIGNYSISKRLIDFGARKNVADKNGITPLEYAISAKNENLIKLLSN
jgi:uncharacterized protein